MSHLPVAVRIAGVEREMWKMLYAWDMQASRSQ
jgi:hypothetical protein